MNSVDAFSDLLLHGLSRVAFHNRIEHTRPTPIFRRHLVPARRTARLKALAELTHNWPDVVAGRNRFHTPQVISGQIRAYLDQFDHDRAEPHDAPLHQHLRRIGLELTAFSDPGHP